MHIRRFLTLGLALFLSGCFFTSREPLFSPADFVTLPFNGSVFHGQDGRIQIRQYGSTSRTYGLTMVEKSDDAPDINFYRAGFVPLGPNLFVVQVVAFAMDGPSATLLFSNDAPITPRDHSLDSENAMGEEDTPYAYIFVEAERAPMEDWASETVIEGIEALNLYVTLKNGIVDSVEKIAAKHHIELRDGYILPSGGALSTDELKAFFLEVFETHKSSFSDPQRFELKKKE